MSGSSAVASARRRRAEPTPQSNVQPGKNSTSSNQINTQNDSSQKLTPNGYMSLPDGYSSVP